MTEKAIGSICSAVSVVNIFVVSSWGKRYLLREVRTLTDSHDSTARALIQACALGQIEEVVHFLDHGTSPNVTGKRGTTPLMEASFWGHKEIVDRLLKDGADVNAKNDKGETALMEACRAGHIEIMSSLFAAGAMVNPREEALGYYTAIMEASMYGHSEVVRIMEKRLLAESIPLQLILARGNVGMIRAAREGRRGALDVFLDSKFEVNASYGKGITALIETAREGHLDCVELLLDRGAHIDQADDDDNTPLIEAAGNGRLEVVSLLLERGARVNAANRFGQTALMKASLVASPEIVQKLIEAGADVNAKNKTGNTALLFACYKGHIEAVRLLMAAGALDSEDNYGNTALSAAMASGHWDLVDLLVARPDSAEVLEKTDTTQLIKALSIGDQEDVRRILDENPDFDPKDPIVETAVVKSAMAGQTQVLKVLLERGASVNARALGESRRLWPLPGRGIWTLWSCC